MAGSILFTWETSTTAIISAAFPARRRSLEISKGLVKEITVLAEWEACQIGLTYRATWAPTKAQELLLAL